MALLPAKDGLQTDHFENRSGQNALREFWDGLKTAFPPKPLIWTFSPRATSRVTTLNPHTPCTHSSRRLAETQRSRRRPPVARRRILMPCLLEAPNPQFCRPLGDTPKPSLLQAFV